MQVVHLGLNPVGARHEGRLIQVRVTMLERPNKGGEIKKGKGNKRIKVRREGEVRVLATKEDVLVDLPKVPLEKAGDNADVG